MLLLYSAGHSATSQSAGYHEGCSIQDMPGAYRPPGRRSSRAERCKPTGAGWADRAGLTRPNSASNSGPDWTGAASLVLRMITAMFPGTLSRKQGGSNQRWDPTAGVPGGRRWACGRGGDVRSDRRRWMLCTQSEEQDVPLWCIQRGTNNKWTIVFFYASELRSCPYITCPIMAAWFCMASLSNVFSHILLTVQRTSFTLCRKSKLEMYQTWALNLIPTYCNSEDSTYCI